MFLSRCERFLSRGDNFAENYFNLCSIFYGRSTLSFCVFSPKIVEKSSRKREKAIIKKSEIYLNINKVRADLHSCTSSLWPFFTSSSKVPQLKFLAHFYESLFDKHPRQMEIPFDTDTYDSLPTENEKLYLSHNGTAERINFIILKFGACLLAVVFIPNIVWKQTPEIMNPSLSL